MDSLECRINCRPDTKDLLRYRCHRGPRKSPPPSLGTPLVLVDNTTESGVVGSSWEDLVPSGFYELFSSCRLTDLSLSVNPR